MTLPRRIAAMLLPATYSHPVKTVRLLQTHASYVFLTGAYAFKVKKAVDLGFLDYTTLDKRRHFCAEEFRLNKRFAPTLYEGVEALVPAGDNFRLTSDDADGAVEYAVRMREFPQEALLSAILGGGEDRGGAPLSHLVALVRHVAAVHGTAPAHRELPGTERVRAVVQGNYDVGHRYGQLFDAGKFVDIQKFTDSFLAEKSVLFEKRVKDGHVRECHGDLHSRNIALINDELQPFDGIEFNDLFRIIDTLSEIAFFVMDLESLGYAAEANRCLNVYLEETGDWEGVVVLPLYLCYRAFVRAKVNALTAADPNVDPAEARRAAESAKRYFEQAWTYAQRGIVKPKLTIMMGVSGSGKSTVAARIAAEQGAIHIRSDAVRKHLAGVPLTGPAQPGKDELYSNGMTERTYERMNELAAAVLDAGFSVVLDARYPKRLQREAARAVAEGRGLESEVVRCGAPREELERRLNARKGDVSDATAELLDRQLEEEEAEERPR